MRTISCGRNVKNGRVKKKMLMNTYHHCGTLIRMCHKNNGKKLFGNSEDEEENDFEGFGFYLVVVENKNQKFVLLFEPELGV